MTVGRSRPIVVPPMATLQLRQSLSVAHEILGESPELHCEEHQVRLAGQVQSVLPVRCGDAMNFAKVCDGSAHTWASTDCLSFDEARTTPCAACAETLDGMNRFARLRGRV